MNKKVLMASAFALPLVTLAGFGVASAATGTNGASFKDDMASKFATRFNLNKTDVATFMDEQHTARRADMQARMTE